MKKKRNYLSFFLPFPDFLPPEELLAPLSPLPLGLELTDLYLLLVDEKTDLFFFLSLFLDMEWLYNLLLDFVLGPLEEYMLGPFLDFPAKESPFADLVEVDPFDLLFQNCP
jgi:hypothetical protein